ncbi:hypothetical protein N7508_011116 [Penicillium antarcticum]|uniref:uncharacterized protein n=1 Tax=Penicillium antarcticum TaxID=416450 RepID=UPI0023828151|nr:uncharacterized protein N7508_011116 [Penicillium antarcticum]KAJ5288341.1 hypothetical protein N7508_011116 [Penicillium antarcticum]
MLEDLLRWISFFLGSLDDYCSYQVLLVSEPGTVLFVYNGSAANALVASLLIFQNITGLRAIHGLIWDEQGQILCAVGTDAAADGTDPVPAYGTIVVYPGALGQNPYLKTRKSLVSEDRGLHAFDIGTGQLTEHYENEVTNDDCHGYTGGEIWALPQSGLKSFNIAPDGSFVYVQDLRVKSSRSHTPLVTHDKKHKLSIGDKIYRSRWFGNLDGWPKS